MPEAYDSTSPQSRSGEKSISISETGFLGGLRLLAAEIFLAFPLPLAKFFLVAFTLRLVGVPALEGNGQALPHEYKQRPR